jgi:ketosteroid isomerase-like protein
VTQIKAVTRRSLLACLVLLATGAATAQTPQTKPEDIVRQWFERWNRLDGSPEATNRLLELYRPDAFHQTGPTEKQIGEVRFEGHDKIRKMIDDFAKANKDISFRIQAVTANEKAAELIHVADGPWGGASVAVQYGAAFTARKDNRRWMYPGAAFFQIQDGKIRGARFYMARDEMMEVVAQ